MASLSLFQHYAEYMSSPAVLLTILVVVGPILLEVFKNKSLKHHRSATSEVKGCFRLGLSNRSNLDEQDRRQKARPTSIGLDSLTGTARIKALFTYPVKSCRGVELAASEVGTTGLKYDRLFTFAQLVTKEEKLASSPNANGVDEVSGDWKHEWRFMTQRDFPRLALLATELWVPAPQDREKARRNGQPVAASKASVKNGRVQAKGQDASPSSLDLPSTQETGNHKDAEQSWASNGGCLIISFPFEPDFNPLGIRTEIVSIRIPLAPTAQHAKAKEYVSEQIIIWKDQPLAFNITNEIPAEDLAKLKYFLGVSNPLGLFRVDHKNSRAVTRSLPKDRPNDNYAVGFADAFPFHMLNLASVQALDDELPSKRRSNVKLDARRFRANVYVFGPSAYAEDSWKRVMIGKCVQPRKKGKLVEQDAEYHVACRTARCKLPNVDQETAVQDANEPLTTLNKVRKVDTGAYPHPVLGIQMIPLFQQGILRVGDGIQVLERGEHVYEKMFP